MDFTLLYHLWHPEAKYLEASSRRIQNGHDIGSMRDKAIKAIEESAGEDGARILRLGIFEEKGIVEITGHGVIHDEFHWKRTWNDVQAQVQGAIHLKAYGLKTSSGYNLSCPDFRCMGKIDFSRKAGVYLSCNNKHTEKDPYYGSGVTLTSKGRNSLREKNDSDIDDKGYDEQFLLPELARLLHEKRETKAQALARFECWKQDTEHRLLYWNPF